ncbi:MAG: hypothetical protein IJS37_01295 [Bacilli bacterium]|nr:hypothetical protein [Bacilli bacterium]
MNTAEIRINKGENLTEFLPLIDLEETGEEFVAEIEEESEEIFALMLGDTVIGIAYIENDDEPHMSFTFSRNTETKAMVRQR